MNNTNFKIIQIFLVSIICFGFLKISNAQTALWNGTTNTNWDEATNWTFAAGGALTNPSTVYTIPATPAGPTTISGTSLSINQLVIDLGATATLPAGFTLAVSNNPNPGTGMAVSGTIINNGLITIDGSTYLNGSEYNGLNVLTTGSMTNHGNIKVGFSSAEGHAAYNGINNEGTFVNEVSGIIQIENSSEYGILQLEPTSIFTNKGNITIGQVSGTDNLYYDGIYSEAIFTNEAGATITIDNTQEYGLDCWDSGSFTNSGTINIGQNGGAANIGYSGIVCNVPFINNAAGVINIDNTVEDGFSMRTSLLTNDGNILIGQNGPIGYVGIENREGMLQNNFGGIIKIDNTGLQGIWLRTSINNNNSGTISIGATGAIAQQGIEITYNSSITNNGSISIENCLLEGIKNYNLFTNNVGGILQIADTNNETILNVYHTFYETTGIFHNYGIFKGKGNIDLLGGDLDGTIALGLSPGTMTFSSDQTFLGTSTLEIEVDGNIPNTEHDQIIVLGTATISGSLSVSVSYAPSSYDRIVFLTATSISGTFLNPTLPADWAIDYSIAGEVAIVYSGILPVELINFSTKTFDKSVQLEWQTASEINNAGFEIQHSTDGRNWEEIGFENGIGNSTLLQTYHFQHDHPNHGANYYRLKQMDFDDQFEYSQIRHALFEDDNQATLSVFPNPNSGQFSIEINNPNGKRAIVQLYTSSGSLIWKRSFSKDEMPEYWKKDFSLKQEDMYFLVTQVGDKISSQKIAVMINH